MRILSKNTLLISTLLVCLACETTEEGADTEAESTSENEDVQEELDKLLELEEDENEDEDEDETPDIREAEADFDSIFEPAADVYLGGSSSNHSFIYEDAVSYPGGDKEDWIRFQTSPNTNDTRRVHLTLTCTDVDGDAESHLQARLYLDGESLNKRVSCLDGTKTFTLKQNTEYDLRIYFSDSVDAAFAQYEIQIED